MAACVPVASRARRFATELMARKVPADLVVRQHLGRRRPGPAAPGCGRPGPGAEGAGVPDPRLEPGGLNGAPASWRGPAASRSWRWAAWLQRSKQGGGRDRSPPAVTTAATTVLLIPPR